MVTNGEVDKFKDEAEARALQGKPEASREAVGGLAEPVALVSSCSPFFTFDEAAAYARCSKRTIQRWTDAEKLSIYGHGRPLVLKDELHAFLMAGKGTEA